MALVQEVSLEASFENLKIQAISSFSSLCFLLVADAVSSQLAAAATMLPTSLSWPTLVPWNRQSEQTLPSVSRLGHSALLPQQQR